MERNTMDPPTSDDELTVEPPPQEPFLLEDLQLEIIARADDVSTIIRCAAACKPLRHAILGDQAFRRRLALRAAAAGGFDPALLVDVSCRIEDDSRIVVEASRRLPFESRYMNSYDPACSRDGILVMWRNRKHEKVGGEYWVQLAACDVFTGRVTNIRRAKKFMTSRYGVYGGMYRPALLTVGDDDDGGSGGRSFELLAMDRGLRIQTFSSREGGKGGASHQLYTPEIVRLVSREKVCRAPAAVIGRTVHWLCHLAIGDVTMIILAVHADTAQATAITLPDGCITSVGRWNDDISDPAEGRLMLVATENATRLNLLVAETSAISMWTHTPDEGSGTWSQRVVVRRRELSGQLGSGLDTYQGIRFLGFGERSGAVLFWIKTFGLVLLSLVTNKATLLRRSTKRTTYAAACLHEVNVDSLLRSMKLY